MSIVAGRLRHRITIQSATEAQDAHGGTTRTWADVATVWGSIEPLRGREFMNAQQLQSEVTHRVQLRYYAGVTTAYRLRFGTRLFNIVSVLNPSERNIELEIMAVESV